MSTLEKLQIRGIRSFDPQEGRAQVIQFFTPVTLIVGQNGCGKTTIIEALKYVITNGFPPGTDSGRYFINDPKLSSGYEVLGQVNLELSSADGYKVQATRRIRCTQKANAKRVVFSSLEGTLRTNKSGQWKDWSTKCIDMKTEMCRLMGVSEAILNYVIFCHQEDSCWPLDEGKKVKERFDAIFNTTGYIQSLKLLDVKDKELGQKLKEEENSLRYAEKNMDIVKQKRRELENHEVTLASIEASHKKYEEEQTKLAREIKVLENIEQNIAKHTSVVSVCREKVRSGEESVKELKETIKEEFSGDIAELEQTIKEFKRSGRKKQEDIGKKSDVLKTKERELQTLRTTQQNFLVKEGQFKQASELQKEHLGTLRTISEQVLTAVRKLKQGTSQDYSLNLSAIDSFIECSAEDSAEPEVILKAISSACRAKDSELFKLKATLEEKERAEQAKIDELRSKKASLETEAGMKKEQIAGNKKTLDELRNRLNAIEGSNDALALLDDEEMNVAKKIEQIEKSGLIAKYEGEVLALSASIKELEDQIGAATAQVDLLLKDKALTDQIAIFKRQKGQKQNECSEIMRRIEEPLREILGTVPSENVGSTLEQKIKELRSEVTEKQKELQLKQREKLREDAELRQVTRELERKRRELEDWKNQIAEITEDGDFNELYESVGEKLDEAQKDSLFGEAAEYLYKKYIQQLSKKPCCPLCKRNFDARTEAEKLKKDIERRVEDMQTNRPNLKDSVEKLKKKYDTFMKLKPSYDEKSQLETHEIPTLTESKKDLEEKISSLKEELEEIEIMVSALNQDSSTAQSLIKDVTMFEQNQREVTKLEASISKLDHQRDPLAVESTVTLQDAQAELESFQGTLKAKRLEKENKEKLRSRKMDELDVYRTKRNSVQEKKLRITSEMQNREALENQKRELEDSNRSLAELIQELTRQIPGVRAEIAEAERRKADFMTEKDAKLQEVRRERESFQAHASRVTELKRQLEAFEASKVKFAEVQRRMTDCNAAVEQVEDTMRELREAVAELQNEIAAHEVKERDLSDNLKLKLKLKELEELRGELAGKENLLKEAEKKGGVTSQKRDLVLEHSRIVQKQSESRGKSEAIKQSIQSIQRDLATNYKNAETDYRDRLIHRTVYDRAQVDIRRYKKALDHAIMTFHKKRMESINRSLKRYWQQIYRGNDIDMIQIKTEDEDTGKEAQKVELKSRKSYSYRVVMVKRGVEIDMRGRCSAGQKVLASIIIRIALAEAFSSKCGIIALDEPTTNLDECNIQALADCLSSLSQRMSVNRTFQLILITHDAPFMERLLEVGQIDEFYRVKRDQSGHSQIIRVPK